MPGAVGTLAWGLAAGAILLAIRSVWPIVLVHWLLNVWLDLLVDLQGLVGAIPSRSRRADMRDDLQ